MDNLPEVLQYKINSNIHELNFVDTLNFVKQLVDADVELTPTEDTNTTTLIDISVSYVEAEFTETSFDSLRHVNGIETLRDVFEYRRVVEATPLTNNTSTAQQTQPVTSTNKILIDLSVYKFITGHSCFQVNKLK
jgi:hypothetical protein